MVIYYSKSQLTGKLKSLGYDKNFCKFAVCELYGLAPDQREHYTEGSLYTWLECHCRRPMTQYDYDQADEYYNFEYGSYKQYSDWMYYIINGLLVGDIKKYLTHLH